MASPLKLLCPADPAVSDATIGSQKGKVFIVTGGNSGIGKELVTILFSKEAKIYMAARSAKAAATAIAEIRAAHPASTGDIIHLQLDLADLSTIPSSAATFLSQESRLDILFNNAGVMTPPDGSTTAQGHELQMGVNSIGTWFFTKLVYSALLESAKSAPKGTTRVVWVSSSAAAGAPKPALDFENMDYKKRDEVAWAKYERSKAGTIALATEYARRSQKNGEGVIHVSVDPGIYRTNLQRDFGKFRTYLVNIIGKDPKLGAFTQMFAGFHDSIAEDNGAFVIPYGKIEACRKDLQDEELGLKFWDWTEKQTQAYLPQ